MKISNETKVGALAAVSITILILGYNFMKGENLFTSYNTYYAAYDDVEGLFKSNPVMINGYKVGQVSNVEMDPRTLKLLVEIKVPNNIKVQKDAVVKIINTDLIGSKGIQVLMGSSKVIAKTNDTLPSDKDQGMAKAVSKLIAPLSEKLNVLLSELNTQLGDNQLKNTFQNLNKTLVSVDNAVKSLEGMILSKNGQLTGILDNFNGISGDLKASTPKVKSILGNLEETSEELKKLELEQTVNNLKKVLADLSTTLSGINHGNGTLGKLATDDALYKKMDNMVVTIQKLAEDIEKYPSRYTGITKGQRKRAEKEKQKSNPK